MAPDQIKTTINTNQPSSTGLYTQQNNCAQIDRNTTVETCPTKYLDVQNVHLSFEPEKQMRSEHNIKERFLLNCALLKGEQTCELDLSNHVQSFSEWFRRNEFQIQYKCEGT